MTRRPAPALTRAPLWFLVTALCACTSPPPPQYAPPMSPPPAAPAAAAPEPGSAASPRYRCEQGIAFSVHFGDGTALVDAGPRGREQLLRDAGGVTPQQTVYSNQQLRAEFGLGPDGRDAILHYATPPLQVRCVRE